LSEVTIKSIPPVTERVQVIQASIAKWEKDSHRAKGVRKKLLEKLVEAGRESLKVVKRGALH
jgi:hypothetical protein